MIFFGAWIDYVAPVPLPFRMVVGDAIHNIRSALDHLAWQLVLRNNGTPDGDTAFPIFEDRLIVRRGTVHVRNVRVSGDIHPDALTLIEAAQPYNRTDDPTLHPLWAVNELSNIDKHRLPVVLATAFNATRIWIPTRPYGGGGGGMSLPRGHVFLKEGAYLGSSGIQRGAYNPDVPVEADISPRIAFGEGEPCGSEPVPDAIQVLLDAVSDLIDSFRRFF